MMKEIKKYFKLMKYGHDLKKNILVGLILFVLGSIYPFLKYEFTPIGCSLIAQSIMYMTMVMLSHLDSAMVAASPIRRELETKAIDLLQMIGAIVISMWVLFLTYIGVNYSLSLGKMEIPYEWVLVINGYMIAGIMFYTMLAQKHVWLGVFVLSLTFGIGLIMEKQSVVEIMGPLFEGRVILSVFVFLLQIIVSVIASMIYRRVFYRKYRPRRVNVVS